MRRMIAATAAVLLSMGIVLLGGALPASALSGPAVPPALPVLGSEVSGAAVSGATVDQTMMAVYAYKLAKSPTFWQAVSASQAGTATSAQTAEVAAQTASFAAPATKLGGLTKVVGGAATVISGYTAGASLGHGIATLMGISNDNQVCAAGGVYAVLSGTDCSNYSDTPVGFDPNADIVPQPSGFQAYPTCYSFASGVCTVTFDYPGLPQKTQTGLLGVRQVTSIAQTVAWFYWCRNTTTGAIGTTQGGTAMSWTSAGAGVTNTAHWTCPTGSVMYASVLTSTAQTNNTPDLDYANGTENVYPRKSRWWFSGDSPNYVAGVDADPSRVLRCVLTYTNSTTSSADSATFTEGSGVLPQVVCPTPTSGLTVGDVKILEVGGGQTNTLYDQPTIAPYQNAPRECDSGTCLLDLKHNGVSCFQSPDSCTAWFTDPNKASTYSCSYGTHAVDLSECTVYAPTFTAQARATGNYYGDPSSGDVMANPNVAGGAATGTASSSPDPASCWGSLSWGDFNPLDWVLTPVKCALQWAFVPSESAVEADTAGVQDAWAATSIAQAPSLVGGILPTSVASGCGGVPIDMSFTWPTVWAIHWTFGAACDPPLSTTAATVSLITTFLVIGGTLYSSARYLASIIEFTGPTSGGGS